MKAFPSLVTASVISLGIAAVSPVETMAQAPQQEFANHVNLQLRYDTSYGCMTRVEYGRVLKVLRLRKAREDRELAAYAKFKMDQRIMLAKAAAPRSLVIVNLGVEPAHAGEAVGSAMRIVPSEFLPSTSTKVRTMQWSSDAHAFLEGNEPMKEYPARFYRRQAQEESADRLELKLDTLSEMEAKKAQLLPLLNFLDQQMRLQSEALDEE